MNGSGHLLEDFAQPIHLCPVCLHKVTTLTGATVQQTYDLLIAFYNKHNAKEESNWINERIKSFAREIEPIVIDDNEVDYHDNKCEDFSKNSRKRKRVEKMTIQLDLIDTRTNKRPRRITAKYS